MEKKKARSIALEERKGFDPRSRSLALVNKIIESKILDKFNNIGIYYPIGYEMDITPLVDYYSDKSFYLPIIREEIAFKPYSNILVKGLFHSYEPKYGEIVERDSIDCFIIPCVGISVNNRRIGYGKGYYDKYLEGYNGYKIGISYKEHGSLDCDTDIFDLVLDEKILG